MKQILFLIIISVCLFPINLFSDMGAIIPIESVKLDEPAQRAIIAYDGIEEILILQTEYKSSNSTKVLRFIPLPTLPDIKVASKNIFTELNKLIIDYSLKYIRQTKSLSQSAEKIKIELKKTIGAHNITVVKVNNVNDFINWVEKYFKSYGYNFSIKHNQTYIDMIKHYIDNNINYFVFDLINLNNYNTIQPIMYEFNSKTLYYPLVATNVLKSYGSIELFIISETGRHYISSVYGFMPSTTAIINSKEMSKLSPRISNLLGKHAVLQAFKYKGKLFFKNDINEGSGITTINLKQNKFLYKKHD